MRSPEDMKIIQIDITNACIHNCSNCTRMCGHHQKPFFMSWETFKRAVDSLDGFEGGIGMMGGEPTLHPEFERFAQYLGSKYGDTKEHNYFIQPTKHFMRDRKLEERNRTYTYQEKNGMGQRVKGPVLFSSLASNYHKYYEVIQDVFRYQGINDHEISCYHQPILVSRNDLNIKDEEWEELRDKCWIQNTWSASITPKGCFFCEIAAALDMLFDGPGGWPIEKDWWKRKPEDFADQLHWCELCGVALNTKSRDANQGIDDVSDKLYEMLEKINSPKLKKGCVNLYTKKDAEVVEEGDNRKSQYHDNNLNRLSLDNQLIYPKQFGAILIADEQDTFEMLAGCVISNRELLGKMIVFADESMISQLDSQLKELDVEVCVRAKLWGENINKANKFLGEMSYNIIMTSGVRLDNDFTEVLKKYVINPGSIHVIGNNDLNTCKLIKFEESNKEEKFVLYNTGARTLKEHGYDNIRYCDTLNAFINCWDARKTVVFDDIMLKGQELINDIEYPEGYRYVVYGTGTYGEKAYQEIKKRNMEVVFFCDSSPKKQGTMCHGLEVLAPSELKSKRESYDKVVIAALAYKDIRNVILKSGLTDQDIVAPIF